MPQHYHYCTTFACFLAVEFNLRFMGACLAFLAVMYRSNVFSLANSESASTPARYTQRAALTIGAAFAKKQGDTDRANTYSSAASAVGATVAAHYANGFIFESTNREKDASVITALNDGNLNDGTFAPSGKEAAGTVSTLNTLFCDSFAINQVLIVSKFLFFCFFVFLFFCCFVVFWFGFWLWVWLWMWMWLWVWLWLYFGARE